MSTENSTVQVEALKTFAIATCAALLSLSALAQEPASASASAAGVSTLTPDTSCGAPGTGLAYAGNYREKILTRTVGKPGARVDSTGRWVACKMPRTVHCRARQLLVWRGDGGRWCTPYGLALPASTKLGERRGVTGWRTQRSNWVGRQTWECTPQGWQLVREHCS